MADELFQGRTSRQLRDVHAQSSREAQFAQRADAKALDEAVASVEDDKSIRAVIMRGNGRGFCSGIDLAEAERLEGGHSPVNLERIFKRLENTAGTSHRGGSGPALAGGCELALHCDIRVAADDLRMGMTVARVGLVVPYNFIRKLVEIIGAANTSQILYTAEPVDAQRALQMGMVHEVVPVSEARRSRYRMG